MSLDDKPPDADDLTSKVIEGYYLETQEGLFFAVKGLEHPPDRIIAVLRYTPDSKEGDREKDGKTYRRLYHFEEQEQLIQTAFPQYLAYDPVFRTKLQSVPRSMVRCIFDPCYRLQELTQELDRAAIEEDALAFTSLLQNEAQVPLSAIGITGSLLVGLHTGHSDLDVVVFGAENCRKVYQSLRRMLNSRSSAELHRLDDRGLEELYAQRIQDTHIEFQEFVALEKQKVNQGIFRERTYFIRFVKESFEASETYGQLRYTPLGRAVIKASIADDQDAIFTPCRYILSGVHILEGPQVSDLNEIVSFRGRFCEQARLGDSVRAEGTLERIHNSEGDIWYRLLLGNFPEDTMVRWR